MDVRSGADYGVYLVTDRPACLGRDVLAVIEDAVLGGASLVQLREKNLCTRDFVALARKVKALLDARAVPLIINDRVDVALAVGAAGVHVGQSDMPFPEARRLMGPKAIVGLSVDSLLDVLRVEEEGWDPDYLGVGPVFATTTKSDAGPPLGLDGFSKVRALTSRRLVAIGAITQDNAAQVMAAGADGLAVVSAICSSASPRDSARMLRRAATLGRREGGFLSLR